jgi:hypothetical protein
MTMSSILGPGLLRDLTEAKADLTRHGIVLIRMIETDIEPAIVIQAKASISSSPNRLSQIKEEELDRLMDGIRKMAMKSSLELRRLYTRLLATMGTEFMGDLAKELEGIGELFKWDRIAKAVDPVSRKLQDKGFAPIALSDPGEVSEAFKVELEQKWPAAFARFRNLVEEASTVLAAQAEQEKSRMPVPKQKKTVKKR